MSSIDRLRELSEAATPGPWVSANPPDGPGESMFWGADGWTVGNTLLGGSEAYIEACRRKGREPYESLIIRRPDGFWRTDAELIVAAVNHVRDELVPIEPVSEERLARYVG